MSSGVHLEVRLAGPEDSPVIAAVLHASFVEFESLYTEGGFAATALGSEQVLIRMREGPVWVALREGVLMDTVAAVVKDESVYVRGMTVLPAARGSGTGTALLQQVEGWSAGQRCGRIFLSTTQFLDSAIRLYERFGFGGRTMVCTISLVRLCLPCRRRSEPQFSCNFAACCFPILSHGPWAACP